MFTINTFSITRLNNAEFTGFMINLQKAIATNDATNLGVSTILPSFSSTLERLIDQVYNAGGSAYTVAMQQQDDRRIQIFRRIRLRLQTTLYAETNQTLLALQPVVQTHLLSKYATKISQMAYHAKTAVIEGFLYDLTTKLGDEGIEALGIGEEITALEEANNGFIAAYNARAVERAEGDTGVTVKLRQEMFSIYQQICFTVQYLANTLDQTLAEKATACPAFIAVLNVILDDAKKRYIQRLANGNDDEDDDDIEDGGDNGNGGGSTGTGDSEDEGDDNGSGSGSNPSNPSDDGGSGGSDNGGDDSNGGNGGGNSNGGGEQSSGGNTTDPNAPSENGVVNGDEVSF